MHTNSLGLQAIVSRTFGDSNGSFSQSASFHLTPTDFAHVQEVIDSTLTTLKTAVDLYNKNVLIFCSMRTFLHVTTASIFLLKGLGLGVSPGKLRDSLGVLKQVVVALNNSNPDDLHVGGRYTTLLEMHMAKLQEHFVPSFRPHNITPPNSDPSQIPNFAELNADSQFDFSDCMDTTEGGTADGNWLSLPLDPTLLSFGMENFQGLQCLGDDSLDFLWNLGA